MKMTSMRSFFFLLIAFLICFADTAKAAETQVIRPQESGASYVFDKQESQDVLELKTIVANGHDVQLEGRIMDMEYFVADVSLLSADGTVLQSETIASSQNTAFSFDLQNSSRSGDGYYTIRIAFEEVFGTHDRDATVRLTATSKTVFDGGRYEDASDIARNALSVSPNSRFDGYLALGNTLDAHRFTALNDSVDMYEYQLLAGTKYHISLAPEGSLAANLSLTDMTGREIDSATSEQSGQALEFYYEPSVTAPVLLKVDYSDHSLSNKGRYQLSVQDSRNALGVTDEKEATHSRLKMGSPAIWHLKQRIGTKLVAEGGLKTKGAFEAQLILRRGSEELAKKSISGNTSTDFRIEILDGKTSADDYSEYELELVQTKGAPESVVFLDKEMIVHTDANSSSDAGDSFKTALSVSQGNIENNYLGAGFVSRDLHIANLSDESDVFKIHLDEGFEYHFDLRHDNGAVIDLQLYRPDERRIAKDGIYISDRNQTVYAVAKLLNPGAADAFNYDILIDSKEIVAPAPVVPTPEPEIIIDERDAELERLRQQLAEKEAALASAQAQITTQEPIDTSARDIHLAGSVDFDLNLGEKRSIHIVSDAGVQRTISLTASDAQGISVRADLYKDDVFVGSLKALGSNPDALQFSIDGSSDYRIDLDVEKILGNKKNVSIAIDETLTDYSASLIDQLSSGDYDLYFATRTEVADNHIYQLNQNEYRYRIPVENGERISVSAQPNDYLALSLDLMSEDGTLLGTTSSSDSGVAAAFDYKAMNKGYLELIVSVDGDLSRGYYGDTLLNIVRDASEIVITPIVPEVTEIPSDEELVDPALLKGDVSHSSDSPSHGAPLFLFVFLGVLVVGVCPIIFQYYVKEK